MELFKRVKKVSNELAGSETKLATKIGVNQRTLNGYLRGRREDNLWALLPMILAAYPQISREWLYFDEGEMLQSDADSLLTPASAHSKPSKRRVTTDLPYPDDALGRIAMLTNIRTSSALELQSLFGVDFKEIKKFLSRYNTARQALAVWHERNGSEDERPASPEVIPDEWLHHFWTRFGPNPGWIQYGERDFVHAPLLREIPRDAELVRLHAELLTARQECAYLRTLLSEKEKSSEWDSVPGKAALMQADALGGLTNSS